MDLFLPLDFGFYLWFLFNFGREARRPKYISSRVFENQPYEISNHLSEKASKGRFLKPKKLQNHRKERKGKKRKEKKRKSEENVALLVFTIVTLEILRKKTSVARKRS